MSYGRKKSKIEVLCKEGIDLEQFCTQNRLEVEKGVKTNYIRPAGKRDVEVTVVGLGFNTPDSLVQEYIMKFGVNHSVVRSKSVVSQGRHRISPYPPSWSMTNCSQLKAA